MTDSIWLALMIGNSRLHWAWFVGETLGYAWDSEFLPASAIKQLSQELETGQLEVEFFPPDLISQCQEHQIPLYLASVVPSQAALWQTYPDVNIVTLDQIPLQGVYPTLGIDRALALWGAGETWGWPMLVIDAGTALTLTGADANRCLIGGAILPGLSLQLKTLEQATAELPGVDLPKNLPPRWALNTPDAIHSGVVYTLLAAIKDFINEWWRQFPGSCVTLTGGDRTVLLGLLQSHEPEIASAIVADRHLIFWGMRSCRSLS